MWLKTKVKVGKITNLSDARYCAGMGVDMLGFPAGANDPSLDIKSYQEITAWVSGPQFVLEWMGNEIPHDFSDLVKTYNADFIQIRAHDLGKIPTVESSLMIAIGTRSWPALQNVLRNNKSRISYLVLTSEEPSIDKHLINQIGSEFQVLLNVGASKSSLEEVLSLPIAGLALEGTDEGTPGLKEYSSLSEILEQLETDE